MDTELLRTFLEVEEARHFGRAADTLFITQAAVSSRIKLLEQMLGTQLFVRHRNNLQLTDCGDRLVAHAEEIIQAWEHAKQDLSIRKNNKTVIRFAATTGFCALILQDSLGIIYRNLPQISLRADSLDEETLVARLRDRRLDLALLFDPSGHTDFVSSPVAGVELVLVSTKADISLEQALKQGYVSVEWGRFFAAKFRKLFPDSSLPTLQTSLSRIALDFILDYSGSAYLPLGLVKDHLDKALFRVEDAPVIHQPIYAIYHANSPHAGVIEKIIQLISNSTGLHTAEVERMPGVSSTTVALQQKSA